MKKIINSRLHGILDYATVIFLAASPTVFHMEGALKNFTYGLAVVHLLLTTLTHYGPGIVKLIPFKIHGIIELVVAVVLIAVAFAFGKHPEYLLGFKYYLWLAVVILAVFLLTDFRSTETSGN